MKPFEFTVNVARLSLRDESAISSFECRYSTAVVAADKTLPLRCNRQSWCVLGLSNAAGSTAADDANDSGIFNNDKGAASDS